MSHSVTLELPDNLYKDLQQRSFQTSRSIEEELLTAFSVNMPIWPSLEGMEHGAYGEVMEFLGSGPSASEITQFRLSDTTRERVRELMKQERERTLTDTEISELDFYVELGDFLGLLRAKALLHLDKQADVS